MGGIGFTHKIQARTPEEAFQRLVEEATYESGNDSYNGTISTCSMARRATKTYKVFDQKVLDEVYNLIDKEDGGTKWLASYFDCGVSKVVQETYKKVAKQPTVKYAMKYCVILNSDFKEEKILYKEATKKQADDKAMAYLLKNGGDVTVEKRYVRISGDATTTEFKVEKKELKPTAKRPKPMPNRSIVEYHTYVFYGIASC